MVHKELRREQQDNTIIPKAEFKWGCGNFREERKRERERERERMYMNVYVFAMYDK